MTNSTPSLIAWTAQYREYLKLVDQGLHDEAALLKAEIDEGLPWVELTWEDLEHAYANLDLRDGDGSGQA
ncbi:MAG: hypothetical protein ACPHGV_06725 [Synechococcus sp.]